MRVPNLSSHRNKIFAAAIILAGAVAAYVPHLVKAGGGYGSYITANVVGQTTTIEHIPSAYDNCGDVTNYTIDRATLRAEGLDNQGQPLDFSNAGIKVEYYANSVGPQLVPGQIASRSATEITWVADQPFSFTRGSGHGYFSVNNVKILQPGRTGIAGGFIQVDGNNCIGSIPTYTDGIPNYLDKYIVNFNTASPSASPSATPLPTPTPTPTPSPSPSPTPTPPPAGFVNPGTLEVTVPRGGYQHAFRLQSTTAGMFSMYGYPTTYGPGINWTPSSGGIHTGGTTDIAIEAIYTVPVGTYTGMGRTRDEFGGEMTFPVTVHVVEPTPTPSPSPSPSPTPSPTPQPNLEVSNVQTTNITRSSAKVNWTTNLSAQGQVQYGKSATALTTSTPMSPAYVTSNSASLSGLSKNTTYYYRVKAVDYMGKTVYSPVYSFKTLQR